MKENSCTACEAMISSASCSISAMALRTSGTGMDTTDTMGGASPSSNGSAPLIISALASNPLGNVAALALDGGGLMLMRSIGRCSGSPLNPKSM